MTTRTTDKTLIGDLYDAAIDQEQWPALLDRIAYSVGAKGSAFLAVNSRDHMSGHTVLKHSTIYQPDDIDLYQSQYSHFERSVYKKIETCQPSDIVYEDGFCLSKNMSEHPDKLINRPDIKFLTQRYGVFHRTGIRVNEDPGWLEVLTCQFSTDTKPEIDAITKTLQILQPHLTQTLVLSRTFSELRRHFRAVLTALDHVHLPMFVIVGDAAHVLLSNYSAKELIDINADITIDGRQRLYFCNDTVNAQIMSGLSEILLTNNYQGHTAKKWVVVPRGGGRDPYLVELSPLNDPTSELDDKFRGALVTVIDPECIRNSTINMQGVDLAYSLTPSESAVAALLVNGLSTRNIAEERGVGQETVKSQISSLLLKTKSRNRTELVRQVLMLNIPIQ